MSKIRSTCVVCGRKRYQNNMIEINLRTRGHNTSAIRWVCTGFCIIKGQIHDCARVFITSERLRLDTLSKRLDGIEADLYG